MTFVLLLAWCGSVVLDGVAFKVLWAWFVSARFGLAPISLATAVGLGLLLGVVSSSVTSAADYLAGQSESESDRNKRVLGSAFRHAFFCGLALLIGLIVKQFA